MPLIINTNIASFTARRHLDNSQKDINRTIEHLASGLRVNSARDDAAGQAISARMTTQSRGMTVAIRNANDGISLGQTAEGALSQLGNMIQRMRDLAVQSANATNTSADRAALDDEYQALKDGVLQVVAQTQFNDKKILSGDAGTDYYQVGANSGEMVTITTTNMSALVAAVTGTYITGDGDIVTGGPGLASIAMTVLKDQLDVINTQRSKYGAAQARFEGIISQLQVTVENQTAAISRIMDADFAAETSALTRSQILQQAGTSVLQQANTLPNLAMQLLRG